MAGLKNARRFAGSAAKQLKKATAEAKAGYDAGMSVYRPVAEEYRPYMDLGKTSASAMQTLFGSPEGLTSDPFYKARKKEQMDAVENSAAAKGSLFGGSTLLELMKKGGEFASDEFDKATARYATGANIGMAATGAYDASKANLAEMEIGKGQVGARQHEAQASLQGAKAQTSMGLFTSWFGGSGPFGQATAGGLGKCYIAAYHFGHATPEHYIIAMHVRHGKTWKARLARVIYTLLHPLFKALLKEAQ